MEDEHRMIKNHKVQMENRQKLSVSGIVDVISFDLNEVLLETTQEMLSIKGKDLHVNRLVVEKGEMDIEGKIQSLVYSEVKSFQKQKENMLGRLFK